MMCLIINHNDILHGLVSVGVIIAGIMLWIELDRFSKDSFSDGSGYKPSIHEL